MLEDGIVRLDAQLDPSENCHAFAVTEIICQEELETTLRIGHNDGAIVWLNKELIYEYPSLHGFKYNEFSVPIKLNKGKNIGNLWVWHKIFIIKCVLIYTPSND